MTHRRYWRTKIVTLTHRWMVHNLCGKPLLLRQVGARVPPVALPHGGRCAWHWPMRVPTSEQMLSLCLAQPQSPPRFLLLRQIS